MAVQGTDAFIISRASVLYKVLGSDILAYVQANLGSSEYKVANIAARNALTGLTAGDTVMVDDATGDGTVTTGWALYQFISGGTWRKVAEQESLDISVAAATNLSYTASPTGGTVVSDTGADASVPLADGTNAGLLTPGGFNKLGNLTITSAFNADTVGSKVAFITVTGAVNLDTLLANSHAAVTLGGSGSTNPLTLTGQQLNFSISNLATAP